MKVCSGCTAGNQIESDCIWCSDCEDRFQAENKKEQDIAFSLLMVVVSLAKSGHPYKNELDELRPLVAKHPVVARLVGDMIESLEKR